MREVDTKTVYRSFFAAVGFFYENGPRLVVLSVLWFLCSLPLVTLGPATLATYVAIQSLREGYHVDRARVVATLKRHGVSACLLTGVPVVFLAISALYTQRYFASESPLALALGVVTAYAGGYAALLLVPTFVGLTTGSELEPALRTAVRWTGRNALSAVMLGLGTVLVFVATGLMTIGFVLVFAGVAFSFHLETLLGTPTEVEERSPGWTPYMESRR